MRLVGIIALACGCNQVFGVDSTALVDAPPPIDAAPPPACPALGETPKFANELYQVPARYCYGYAASSDAQVATAVCESVVSAGRLDESLTALTMTPPMSPGFVRLAPEGDRLFAGVYRSTDPWGVELHELALGPEGAADLGVVYTSTEHPYFTTSTPTRGPQRELVYSAYDQTLGEYILLEIVERDGVWAEKRRTSLQKLGVTSLEEPNLSPDGLRLVFTSYGGVVGVPGSEGGGGGGQEPMPPQTTEKDQPLFYADRASRDEPFGMAQPLMTVPGYVQWPFMTEDCGRIYFSALNTVFYLKQQL